MKNIIEKFWDWYERNYKLNLGVTVVLIGLQIFHLYWLTADVAAFKLLGESFYQPSETLYYIILIVDYLEFPALISGSLLYINRLRKRYRFKDVLYLVFLNSQWLHIFWITDEFVVEAFTGAGGGTMLPAWLAWIAILIDYLELPVLFDAIKQFTRALKSGDATARELAESLDVD